jgi:alcohol dehydrogenase
MLLRLVESGKLTPASLVTHRFALVDMMNAYDTFGNAASERAAQSDSHELDVGRTHVK